MSNKSTEFVPFFVQYTSLYSNNLDLFMTMKNEKFKGYRTSKIVSTCHHIYILDGCFSLLSCTDKILNIQ